MRISTMILLGIGFIPIAWGGFSWAWLLLNRPVSYDIAIPWAILILEIGLCIVAACLLKWLLLDWLLGARF